MIVVIIGPGGVGKGTLVDRLLADDREATGRLWLSRSWTTRPRRANEPPDAYTFVDTATFEAAIAEDRFVEWDEHLGHLYGTPKVELPPGKDVVLEIDVNGAESIRRLRPDAVVVLVAPPSMEVLEQRLLARGDDADSVQRRLRRAVEELERGERIADHLVVNDDLTRAVGELAGILQRHRTPGGTT